MDEAVFKRIPPHNDEAERAVIGSMMMDQDAVQIASEQLQGEDFYWRDLFGTGGNASAGSWNRSCHHTE